MGLFDKLKKKPESAPQAEAEIPAYGWDAITAEFERVYPGQTAPKHYAALVKRMFGGNDPLDGISIYDGGDFWHFVTYGLTELYAKEGKDPDHSGYGYEMTFKLKKACIAPGEEESELRCICGILQAIARLTFTKGERFGPYEFLYTGQTSGIDARQRSEITGFICVPDPAVNAIDTPNGRVEFLEFIGMTDAELRTLDSVSSVTDIYSRLGSDVTDYSRGSVC